MKKNKLLSLILVFVMLFCSVAISAADDSFNINVKLDMKSKGNIFFENAVSNTELKVYNNDNIAHDIKIDINAVGRKYGKKWGCELSDSLSAGSSKKFDVTIDFGKDIKVFDIYDLTITVTKENLSKKFSSEFSYVRYGKRNSHFGINTHFGGSDYRN